MRARYLLMLALLCGCAAVLPPAHFAQGDATRRALAMQVFDPDAGRSHQPLTGMDGRSAAAAQQRYEKSFSAPQQDGNVGVSGK